MVAQENCVMNVESVQAVKSVIVVRQAQNTAKVKDVQFAEIYVNFVMLAQSVVTELTVAQDCHVQIAVHVQNVILVIVVRQAQNTAKVKSVWFVK